MTNRIIRCQYLLPLIFQSSTSQECIKVRWCYWRWEHCFVSCHQTTHHYSTKFTTCYSILSRLKFTWNIYLPNKFLERTERDAKMLILANMRDAYFEFKFHICIWLMILKLRSKKCNRISYRTTCFDTVWYKIQLKLVHFATL